MVLAVSALVLHLVVISNVVVALMVVHSAMGAVAVSVGVDVLVVMAAA